MMPFFKKRFLRLFSHRMDKNDDTDTLIQTMYPHLKSVYKHSIYHIPDLNYTFTLRNGKVKACHHMDPQGMTFVEDYVLISAYNRQPYSKRSKYNSVIYLLDKETGRHVRTIVLPGCPHAGGLAYDEKAKRLWIADKAKGCGALSAVSYQTIRNYDFTTSHQPINYDFTIVCDKLKNTSFLTMDDDYLYTGLHHLQGGPVYRYALKEDRLPDGTMEYLIHETKIQGIAIYKGYMLISKSSGPHPSQLSVYKGNQCIRSIDFPPYMEQITVYEDTLYILFESGGSAFLKYKKIPHIHWILKVNIRDIIGNDL